MVLEKIIEEQVFILTYLAIAIKITNKYRFCIPSLFAKRLNIYLTIKSWKKKSIIVILKKRNLIASRYFMPNGILRKINSGKALIEFWTDI